MRCPNLLTVTSCRGLLNSMAAFYTFKKVSKLKRLVPLPTAQERYKYRTSRSFNFTKKVSISKSFWIRKTIEAGFYHPLATQLAFEKQRRTGIPTLLTDLYSIPSYPISLLPFFLALPTCSSLSILAMRGARSTPVKLFSKVTQFHNLIV